MAKSRYERSTKRPRTLEHFSSENTAVIEYLDAVRHEYDCQSDIKVSFENRSGFLLTLLGAVCVFVFEKINLSAVVALCKSPLTFQLLVEILCGFGVYAGFLLSLIMIVLTITAKKQKTFEPDSVTNAYLEEERYKALVRLVAAYIDATKNRIELNKVRGRYYRWSLIGIVVAIVSITVYVSM